MTDEEQELKTQIERVRGDTRLPRPARPVAPAFTASDPLLKRLHTIQKYIYSLEYNHTSQNFFNVSKERPYGVIMAAAREITRYVLATLPFRAIHADSVCHCVLLPHRSDWFPLALHSECLPIKCMEAVMLALLFTNCAF